MCWTSSSPELSPLKHTWKNCSIHICSPFHLVPCLQEKNLLLKSSNPFSSWTNPDDCLCLTKTDWLTCEIYMDAIFVSVAHECDNMLIPHRSLNPTSHYLSCQMDSNAYPHPIHALFTNATFNRVTSTPPTCAGCKPGLSIVSWAVRRHCYIHIACTESPLKQQLYVSVSAGEICENYISFTSLSRSIIHYYNVASKHMRHNSQTTAMECE